MISGGFVGHLFYCRLKFWRQAAKTITSDEQSSPILRELYNLVGMESETENFKNHGVRFAKKRKSAEDSALFDNVASEKLKFPLYIFPDTMEKVNMLYETDNCRSKTEFMEKAIRFYCGYLLNKESTATEFIAPQLAVITEGIVKGSEQKLSRALFKLAVEVGALTHMLAAINEIDDETLKKLRIMCVDEVKRINGIINFEKAVRYQRSGD